uniref:Uncharacterized protein n=1 Tax=Oryza glumipatula TaxID=40148 RepID=A0A0E0BQY7_9ORYZ
MFYTCRSNFSPPPSQTSFTDSVRHRRRRRCPALPRRPATSPPRLRPPRRRTAPPRRRPRPRTAAE